ncbi:hypothetical protein [Variovorax sp. J22R115]|uniref:hypothetical protein n=1 Tax=Variovorax sp. J22R115 TaxID=3053509 RepID=UPI002574BF54|nr:hypothetical protein [Variovorax sp. J22R115]MDM0050610.1 hypothetical protein [Variovorax sp. J22R115]
MSIATSDFTAPLVTARALGLADEVKAFLGIRTAQPASRPPAMRESRENPIASSRRERAASSIVEDGLRGLRFKLRQRMI